MRPLIVIVIGARPNLMKVASLTRVIGQFQLDYRLVDTGQHSSFAMNGAFLEALEMPNPDKHLHIKSTTAVEQVAEILAQFGNYLIEVKPDCVVVVGDVNSTLACSLAANKLGVPVAHVEAGLESGDLAMPEEVNRRIVDTFARYLFCSEEAAQQNLIRRGRSLEETFLVGDTTIDTLMSQESRVEAPAWLGQAAGEFSLLTLHRPSNVDDPSHLSKLLSTVVEVVRRPLIFPVHPRTVKRLPAWSQSEGRLQIVEPLPYHQFQYLLKNCKYVLTDSGGVQSEATYYNVPCLTLRSSTERPITVESGTNEILGLDEERIQAAIRQAESGQWKKARRPSLWDGRAGFRVLSILTDRLTRRQALRSL